MLSGFAKGALIAALCAAALGLGGVAYAEEPDPAAVPSGTAAEGATGTGEDEAAGGNGPSAEDEGVGASGLLLTTNAAGTATTTGGTLDANAGAGNAAQGAANALATANGTEDANAGAGNAAQGAVSYDYDAAPYNPTGDSAYPGVYTAQLSQNTATADNPETIGIPSIADANLADAPTTESPAIIQGAAVGYEEKTGATEYTKLRERDAPYSDFTYTIIDEVAQDGTVHKKISGFDGTYVIVRLDATKLFDGFDTSTSYLHVKQDDNRALLVAVGMTANTFVSTLTTAPEGSTEYKAGGVYMTGSYKLSDMYDAAGADTTTPYFDVIVFATASNVSGADAGKAGALNGDVPLHFYVDQTATYNDTTYDPNSIDPNHIMNCLEKFYSSEVASTVGTWNYVVKGSDLALETMVADSAGPNKDTGTTYWSLAKSLEKPYYDQAIDKSPDDPNCGRTVKLMSEVAVIGNLELKGADANNLKKRTLDVNSFDIQVAKNTESQNTGFTLENAWLTLADKSKTTGAEFAIGNNARMLINSGGKLIIDETCQLEIEWDGATTAGGQSSDPLNNGILDLRAGGEVVNNGVITIEGTEGKPYQPGQEQQASAQKGYGEFTVRPGATLTNNGCLIVYGRLYNLGTIVNNGKYDVDPIVSNDPDKGLFTYHRGIQVSWKDDVTQPNVMMGELRNGQDASGGTFLDALLDNFGDIVLMPGKLVNYGTIINEPGAGIYLATATEAIIPIEPTAAAPTVTSKRITLPSPVASIFENYGTLINHGIIVPATVGINDNTSFGALVWPGSHPELFKFFNFGTVFNYGFIWGWPYGGGSAASMPATGDSSVPWMPLAALAAASAAMLFVASRRMRRE